MEGLERPLSAPQGMDGFPYSPTPREWGEQKVELHGQTARQLRGSRGGRLGEAQHHGGGAV